MRERRARAPRRPRGGRGGDALVRPRVHRSGPAFGAARVDRGERRPVPAAAAIDRYRNNGMTTVVGRVRPDPVLPKGIKFVLLSHNTKLGAAKGACLVAEYLVQQGLA